MNFQHKVFSICLGISFVIYLAGYALLFIVIRALDITISWGSIAVVILPGVVWFFLLRHYLGWIESRRRWGRSVLSGSALLVMLITFVQLASNQYYAHFNLERWLNAPESRARMVSDLLHTHELRGLMMQDVIALLGNPTVSMHSDQANQLTYRLGIEQSAFSIDNSWLRIDLDQNRVIDVRITTG
ncbi:hypothetical protein [Paenibacillus guangzhouensis]|uniref:hypothetical protein n=1 Tax=Paenibacillus guangzhouensis TaxID=1473112 RepID=UPI001266DC4A|nr:hypothetical protein [Paenibacillus guangzhouensis]